MQLDSYLMWGQFHERNVYRSKSGVVLCFQTFSIDFGMLLLMTTHVECLVNIKIVSMNNKDIKIF